MFVYQQREKLLDIKDLAAITVIGAIGPNWLARFEQEDSPFLVGNLAILPYVVESSKTDDGFAQGAVRVSVSGAIYEEDLETLASMFDTVYAYYQMPLQNQVIEELLAGPGGRPVQFNVSGLIHQLRRAGADKKRIEKAAGVDSATVDSWISGNAEITIDQLHALINAWPLLPWEYLLMHYEDSQEQD